MSHEFSIIISLTYRPVIHHTGTLLSLLRHKFSISLHGPGTVRARTSRLLAQHRRKLIPELKDEQDNYSITK
jgi:hypothetical protein